MSSVIPDFLPITADGHITQPPEFRYRFDPAPNEVDVPVDRVHEFYITATIHQPTLFTANIFDFPGWTLYLNGEKLPHAADSNTGVIRANLDTDGLVKISGIFNETPLRSCANLISIISLLVCSYMLLPSKIHLRVESNG
jgi:hypothetical protein